MKRTFSSVLICIAFYAFAQDTKKDTSFFDYDFRTYDKRIVRYMAFDPLQPKGNNPYDLISPENTMQTERYTLTDVDKSIKEKAKTLIEQSLKTKSLTALFGKTAICGPVLWNKYLANGGDKSIKGVDMSFHLTGDKSQQTIIGKAIQTDSGINSVWNFVLKSSSKYDLRKPSKKELTSYASLLSPNISEPVFVLSIGGINYIIHIDHRNMTLLFIDQL